LVPVVESRLREGTADLPELEIRQRVCRGPECGKVFYICRSCDRGQRYHDYACRHRARLEQRRNANRTYELSFAAKLDRCARQQVFRNRLKAKLQKVTGQGRETGSSSVSIDSARMISFMSKEPESQAFHTKLIPFPVAQKTGSGLVSCIVCGRYAFWTASSSRLP
jgi:hypothetical protein